MSTTPPPIPDTNEGPRLLIPCGILGVIALVLCCARIYTRVRPTIRLAADDYLVMFGELFSLGGYCLSAVAVSHGWGHVSYYVPLERRIVALKCLFVIELFWIWSIALIRTSLAVTLLRFSQAKIWRTALWTMIVLQTLIPIGSMILLIFGCKPIRAFWEPVATATCWDPQIQVKYGWVCATIFTISDFLLAMLPIKLLRKLNRPRPEKILIGILMAMGLLATSIAIVKMTTFKNVGKGDSLSATVYSSMLAKVEEQVGIIAACAPCLKSTAERALRRIGLLRSSYMGTISAPTYGSTRERGSNAHQTHAGADASEGPSQESIIRVTSDPEMEWKGTAVEVRASSPGEQPVRPGEMSMNPTNERGWRAV